MLLSLEPAPPLVRLVTAYWFIEDLTGEHEGRPVRTSPLPAAALAVTMGRPNATDDGVLVPRVGLLGLQSRARGWRSWAQTYFVMAMLTPSGLARLFPGVGASCLDLILDFGAVAGDRSVNTLSSGATAALEPERVAAHLDRWLLARLAASHRSGDRERRDSERLDRAHHALRRGQSVAAAAQAAEVDRRQLHRVFRRHLGISPKELADLERLQESLRAVQTGRGDGIAGYSDQAHQIRCWRRRLSITPGAYRRAPSSTMVGQSRKSTRQGGPVFYL